MRRDPTFLTSALSILFVLNLLLGTFNLLPVPPLDGHAGIMVLMPEGAAQRYLDWMQHSRNFALLGLIVAWSFVRSNFPARLFLCAAHPVRRGPQQLVLATRNLRLQCLGLARCCFKIALVSQFVHFMGAARL